MTGPKVACSLHMDEDVAIGVVYNCISGIATPYVEHEGNVLSLDLASDWVLNQAIESL